MSYRRVVQLVCRNKQLIRLLKNPKVRYNVMRIRRPLIGTLLFIPTTFLLGNYSFKYTRRYLVRGCRSIEQYRAMDQRINRVVVNGIIALNGIVFLLWQNPKYVRMCERFFLMRHDTRRFFPLLGSMFSHYNHLHIIFNMVAFHSFSAALINGLGPEAFLWYYLSAGCFSGLVSRIGHAVRRSPGASLGASGAIVGLLFLYSRCFPDSRVQLIFLPGINFNIKSAVNTMILFDCIGLALGWRKLDHFGHLGGVLFGFLYTTFFRNSWYNFQKKINSNIYKRKKIKK